MTMGERIKELRKESGLTQEELGKYIGVKKSAIMKYEKGDVQNIKRSSIEILSKLFGVAPSYLMCIDEPTNVVYVNQSKIRRIPVVEKIPLDFNIQNITNAITYELIDEDFSEKKTYFGLKVLDNSLSPRICKNDIVIIKVQADVKSGEYAVVRIANEDANIKRIMKDDNGITLVSNTHIPKYYSSKDIEELPIKIIGKVVELRAKI